MRQSRLCLRYRTVVQTTPSKHNTTERSLCEKLVWFPSNKEGVTLGYDEGVVLELLLGYEDGNGYAEYEIVGLSEDDIITG